MINPRQFEPKYVRVNDPRFAGGKEYFPHLNKVTRKPFKRASEALEYAQRVHARWCRLYDAAMVNAGQETSVERGRVEQVAI